MRSLDLWQNPAPSFDYMITWSQEDSILGSNNVDPLMMDARGKVHQILPSRLELSLRIRKTSLQFET